jgi:hypothetical protein
MANNFHKRHYERIAEVMQQAYSSDAGDGGGADVWSNVVDGLADLFASDNGQFKRDRFVRACVPGNNVRARS